MVYHWCLLQVSAGKWEAVRTGGSGPEGVQWDDDHHRWEWVEYGPWSGHQKDQKDWWSELELEEDLVQEARWDQEVAPVPMWKAGLECRWLQLMGLGTGTGY
jgi:hypothetical protein